MTTEQRAILEVLRDYLCEAAAKEDDSWWWEDWIYDNANAFISTRLNEDSPE